MADGDLIEFLCGFCALCIENPFAGCMLFIIIVLAACITGIIAGVSDISSDYYAIIFFGIIFGCGCVLFVIILIIDNK